MAEELEITSDSTSESATKSTKRRTYEKYTPKEMAEASFYAWYHSHNKASPFLAKFCSNHEIFVPRKFGAIRYIVVIRPYTLVGLLITTEKWRRWALED